MNLSTSADATVVLDSLIDDAALGLSRVQLLPSEQVCRKCYQDLKKLNRAKATVTQHDLLKSLTSVYPSLSINVRCSPLLIGQ